MVGPARLDDVLWTPSPLGCIGPGELGALGWGSEVLYRPLLALHRLPGEVLADHDGSVEVVSGDDGWDRLCAEPDVLVHTHGRPSALRSDERAVVVAVRRAFGRGVRAVLAVRPERLEPRVGEVVMAWYPDGPEPDDRDRLVAHGWLALFRAAADRGIVGLTADVSHTGAREVRALRRLAGFRPVAEDYAAVGLSAPDAAVELDHWRATVADDGAVTVHLDRHDDDPAARAELAGRLARLLDRRDDDGSDPVPPGIEVRLSGPVRLDGCRQWGGGAGSEDDAGSTDVDLPTATRRADRLLARWAADHAPA